MVNVRPSDFGRFWYTAVKDLSDVPIRPEIEPIPIRSTEFADLFAVRITSSGPYRLQGYLSVPKGEGPFPTIYYVPKNASVLEIIPQGTSNLIRSRYVTFSLACRGMRNSDKPYAAMYPGQLTDGISDANTYMYKGVVSDTLRGLDYLMSRPEVDKMLVLAWGNDNAVLAAALHDGVTHVVTTPAYLFDTMDFCQMTDSYPLEEFNDYLRLFQDEIGSISTILEYYNLRWHAQSVTASTLIMSDHSSGLLSPKRIRPLADRIAGEVTVHESERSSYRDGLFAEKWVTSHLIGDGAEPIIPGHWV